MGQIHKAGGDAMTNRERRVRRHYAAARDRAQAAVAALDRGEYGSAGMLLEQARQRANLANAETR